MQTEGAYIAEVMKPMEYVKTSTDTSCWDTPTSHKLNTTTNSYEFLEIFLRDIKNIKNIKEEWEEKRMNKQFLHSLDKRLLDNEQSYSWLRFGDIRGNT
jgi:hypothetical protein